jgi:hypothetical protein
MNKSCEGSVVAGAGSMAGVARRLIQPEQCAFAGVFGAIRKGAGLIGAADGSHRFSSTDRPLMDS